MREVFDILAAAILYGGLFGLAVIAIAIFGIGAKSCLDSWRKTIRSKGAKAVTLMAVVLATRYGGSKTGRVTVDDPYIRDNGSYVTNDYVHIAIAKRYDIVPDDTEILIFYREAASTNAEDWVQYVNQIEPGYFTLADFPADLWQDNATNYNWLVVANYVQPPVVHTNGVWQIKGFIIPAGDHPPSPATYAFPNTKTIKKEDQ